MATDKQTYILDGVPVEVDEVMLDQPQRFYPGDEVKLTFWGVETYKIPMGTYGHVDRLLVIRQKGSMGFATVVGILFGDKQ
jgi:protein involved in polysaccharide export with SLBB domain